MTTEAEPIVAIDHLSVQFEDGRETIRAVDEVSLEVAAGDIYAVVGESGCGKSTLAYTLLDIVPFPGRISGGHVRIAGKDLSELDAATLDRLRAAQAAIVFQAAMNAFNPVLTIGAQVKHILAAHPGVFPSAEDGEKRFAELLELVRLPASQVWRSYESQLSGGMKQRVAIAVALLLGPEVLVLDEPTTALDVLNQRLVIDILKDLHDRLGVTIIFVTHDLAVVAELATKVAVMYAGRLIESGTVTEIFTSARRHPYVTALIDAIPSIAAGQVRARSIPGQVPNLGQLPGGCRFAPRCALAQPYCHEAEPGLVADEYGHRIACHVVNGEIPVAAGEAR